MASSTSSSERLPSGLRRTASDRPGVAQPVPERDVPNQPWQTMALVVLALAVLLTAGWEWKMRSLGLVPGDLGVNDYRWADLRRQIDLRHVPVAILGDSRITFDTDLDRATRLLGVRPLQLGMAGVSGLPILENLADDPHFTGLAIVGINDFLYFSPRGTHAARAIATSRFESPSKRGSYLIQRAIAPYLAMLDDDYELSAIVFRALPEWRIGLQGPHDDLAKFQETGPDGQTWLWRRVEHDRAMSAQILAFWIRLTPTRPVDPAKVRAGLARTRIAVDKIRARGGDVVFVHPPAGPELRAIEERGMPRAKGWDALLAFAHVRGVHIDDLPAAQHLTLPEGSHLTRACAAVFTDAFVRAVAQDTTLVHLQPDAPPPLSAGDCVSPPARSS